MDISHCTVGFQVLQLFIMKGTENDMFHCWEVHSVEHCITRMVKTFTISECVLRNVKHSK